MECVCSSSSNLFVTQRERDLLKEGKYDELRRIQQVEEMKASSEVRIHFSAILKTRAVYCIHALLFPLSDFMSDIFSYIKNYIFRKKSESDSRLKYVAFKFINLVLVGLMTQCFPSIRS